MAFKDSKNNLDNSDQQKFIELGKMLRDFMEMGYISRRQMIFNSFLKGIASGLGAIIGGTLVVALLLWILSLFSEAPFLGEVIDSVKRSMGN